MSSWRNSLFTFSNNTGQWFVYCLSDLEDQGVQFRFWGLRCRLSADCIYYHLSENGFEDLAQRCHKTTPSTGVENPCYPSEGVISPSEGLALADDMEEIVDQIPNESESGNEVNGYLVIKSAVVWLRYWGEKGVETHLG